MPTRAVMVCMKILHCRKRNENINKMESEGEENRQKERK